MAETSSWTSKTMKKSVPLIWQMLSNICIRRNGWKLVFDVYEYYFYLSDDSLLSGITKYSSRSIPSQHSAFQALLPEHICGWLLGPQGELIFCELVKTLILCSMIYWYWVILQPFNFNLVSFSFLFHETHSVVHCEGATLFGFCEGNMVYLARFRASDNIARKITMSSFYRIINFCPFDFHAHSCCSRLLTSSGSKCHHHPQVTFLEWGAATHLLRLSFPCSIPLVASGVGGVGWFIKLLFKIHLSWDISGSEESLRKARASVSSLLSGCTRRLGVLKAGTGPRLSRRGLMMVVC